MMRGLKSRLKRLEGSADGEAVIVWMRFPVHWRIEQRRLVAEKAAAERDYNPPYQLTLENCWSDSQDVEAIFIGTNADFADLLAEIAGKRRLITDRD